MSKAPILATLIVSLFLAATTSQSSASERVVTVRDHRASVTVRDHRVPRKNETVIVKQGRHDCSFGTAQLFKMGYSSVVAYDCDGAVFHYSAMMDAALFRAAMSSHSGAINVTFIGIAR